MESTIEKAINNMFESAASNMNNKKIPIAMRILFAIAAITIFLFIVGIIALFALFMWREGFILTSVLFLVIDLLFIAIIIRKARKTFNEHTKK